MSLSRSYLYIYNFLRDKLSHYVFASVKVISDEVDQILRINFSEREKGECPGVVVRCLKGLSALIFSMAVVWGVGEN